MIKLGEYTLPEEEIARRKKHSERIKQWRLNNPERAKAIKDKSVAKSLAKDPHHIRRRNLKADFNLELEDYEKMRLAQNDLCLICKQPETTMQRGKVIPLSVDHCHNSGKIRGLLCRSCNTGLGAFGDDIDRIAKAIKYLEEYKND